MRAWLLLLAGCTDKPPPGETGLDDTGEPTTPEHTGEVPPGDCVQFPASVDGVDYPDLQAALDAATDGQTVLVCEGTHTGPFVSRQAVVIASVSGDPLTTILDGDTSGSTLTVAPGTELRGLTLTGGHAEEGGGLRLAQPGELAVRGSRIVENTAWYSGGGVWAPAGSTVRLLDSAIDENYADQFGGGIAVGTDLAWPGVLGSTLELEGSTVQANQAARMGGGMYLHQVTLLGGHVTGNIVFGVEEYTTFDPIDPELVVYASAGGVALVGEGRLERTVIDLNWSAAGAGGLYVSGSEPISSATLLDVLVAGNESADRSVGGILCAGAELHLEGDTIVEDNLGPGLSAGQCEVTGGTFRGNTGEQGGGVRLTNAQLRSATITGNTATEMGHAAYLYVGTLQDCIVQDNGPADSLGAIVSYGTASSPSLLSNTDVVDHQGLGLLTEPYAHNVLEVEGSRIQRNALGGAQGEGTLVSTSSDWGTGADDNALFDIRWETAAGTVDYTLFGAAASFTCTETGCL